MFLAVQSCQGDHFALNADHNQWHRNLLPAQWSWSTFWKWCSRLGSQVREWVELKIFLPTFLENAPNAAMEWSSERSESCWSSWYREKLFLWPCWKARSCRGYAWVAESEYLQTFRRIQLLLEYMFLVERGSHSSRSSRRLRSHALTSLAVSSSFQAHHIRLFNSVRSGEVSTERAPFSSFSRCRSCPVPVAVPACVPSCYPRCPQPPQLWLLVQELLSRKRRQVTMTSEFWMLILKLILTCNWSVCTSPNVFESPVGALVVSKVNSDETHQSCFKNDSFKL